MRTEALTFGVFAVFMAVIGLVYWFTSYEPSGTVLLGVAAVLGAFPGFVLWRWSRRMEPRPSDREEASVADGVGVVGTFASSSIWPFVLAGGAAMAGIGLVFGWWAALPGVLVLAIAFVGGSLESRGSD